MISILIHLLGGSYESNDFAKAETIAHSIHKVVPGDQVSLKFLGLVYFRTGRITDAIHLFDRVQSKQSATPEKIEVDDSAVVAVSQEATRRVPYLAQAWRDLGCALLKLRNPDLSPQTFQSACLA